MSRSKSLTKILIRYGKNTLIILCTHYFILRLLGVLSASIIGIDLWRSTSTVKSIVLAIVVLLAYYPILYIVGWVKEKHPKLDYII